MLSVPDAAGASGCDHVDAADRPLAIPDKTCALTQGKCLCPPISVQSGLLFMRIGVHVDENTQPRLIQIFEHPPN